MITLDANVIGTVERSQDELIKERHASHAHSDTRTTAPHARSQWSGGARALSWQARRGGGGDGHEEEEEALAW